MALFVARFLHHQQAQKKAPECLFLTAFSRLFTKHIFYPARNAINVFLLLLLLLLMLLLLLHLLLLNLLLLLLTQRVGIQRPNR